MSSDSTLRGAAEQVHGSLSEAERGLLPPGTLDLAVNTNPFGPPEFVERAKRASSVAAYPDSHGEALVTRWAEALGISRESLVFGAGAVDLIWASVRAFCRPGQGLVVVAPTFSEPYAAAAAAGATAREVRLLEDLRAPAPDPLELAADIMAAGEPGLVYLCSPNNPTGHAWSEDELRLLSSALAPVPLLLDESFHSVGRRLLGTPGIDLLAAAPIPGAIRLRSLTKDFGMPGIRLGYATASPTLAERVSTQLAPWRISSVAQAVGAELIGSEALDFLASSADRWQGCADELERQLLEDKHTVVRGDCPFVLVEVAQARSARRALLAQGIHVRDCTSFGLPATIRVAARPDVGRRLKLALRELPRVGGGRGMGTPQTA